MEARIPIRPTHPRTVKTLQQQKEKKLDESKKVPNGTAAPNSKIVKPPLRRPEVFELQKPLVTSCKTFSDLVKVFNSGTEELRHLLDFECELIYECKMCRSLFRSLSNFVQHKRAYCFERSRDAGERSLNGEVVEKVVHLSENNPKGQLISSRKTMRKDIYELLKSVGNLSEEKAPEPLFTREMKETDAALLAFFQQEGKNPSEERSATLGPDGLIVSEQLSLPVASSAPAERGARTPSTASSTSTAARDAEPRDAETAPDKAESEPPKCEKSSKTLGSLLDLSQDSSSRSCSETQIYYVCPVCQKAVHSPYSVYRHLRTVHNKSLDQVQKLRSKIKKTVVRKPWRAKNRSTSPVSEVKATLPVPAPTAKRSHSPDPTSSPSKTIVEVRSYGKAPLQQTLSLPAFMRKQPLVVLTKTSFSPSMTSAFLNSNSSASAPSTGKFEVSEGRPRSSSSANQRQMGASPSHQQSSPKPNPPKKPRMEKDLSWLKRGPSVPIVEGPMTRTARALYGSPRKNICAQASCEEKSMENSGGVDSEGSARKRDPSAHREPSKSRAASPSDNDTDDEVRESIGDALSKQLSSSEDNVRSLTCSVNSFDSSPAKVDGEKSDSNDRMSTSGVETDLSPDGRVTPNQSDDESGDVFRLVQQYQTGSSTSPPKLSPCSRPLSADPTSDSGSSGSAEDSGVTADERSCSAILIDAVVSKASPKLTGAEPSKADKRLSNPAKVDPKRPFCFDRKADEIAGCAVSSPTKGERSSGQGDQSDPEDFPVEEQDDDALRPNVCKILFGSLNTSSLIQLTFDDLSS